MGKKQIMKKECEALNGQGFMQKNSQSENDKVKKTEDNKKPKFNNYVKSLGMGI